MVKRKKKRTSIRTAAAVAQEQYLARIRALRDDPARVMPEWAGDGPEPKVLAKMRGRLEKMRDGKPGFLDKRDRSVVGAVASILPVADQEVVTHLADHQVDGQRRFYLQRADVPRTTSLGTQNHDRPTVLLWAFREVAKANDLHFFAAPKVGDGPGGFWCTGTTPAPPAAWWDAFAGEAELAVDDQGHRSCPHADRGQVRLAFRGGPHVDVCEACAKQIGHLHGRIAARYVGPRSRQPVEIDLIAPDGTSVEVASESIAGYRGGVKTERDLLREATSKWRDAIEASGAPRFILGEEDFGEDQEAFLDALGAEPWEKVALRVMTKGGHTGRRRHVKAVLDRHKQQLAAGVAAIAGPDFEAPGHNDLRAVLRAAQQYAERKQKLADLPDPRPSGPVGRFMDELVRAHRAEGKSAAIAHAKNPGVVPGWHGVAALTALGADSTAFASFDRDSQEAGKDWGERVAALLDATGDAYVQALAAYLGDSGCGETCRA